MSWKDSIQTQIAARKPPVHRHSQGYTLQSASRVALVYACSSESRFKEVKSLANQLERDYAVARVHRFAFINVSSKAVPVWMSQRLDSQFIDASAVNFWGIPKGEATSFCSQAFDVLINLEPSVPAPLLHVIRNANASMKVGVRQPVRNEDYDVLFETLPNESHAQRAERIVHFLSHTQLS